MHPELGFVCSFRLHVQALARLAAAFPVRNYVASREKFRYGQVVWRQGSARVSAVRDVGLVSMRLLRCPTDGRALRAAFKRVYHCTCAKVSLLQLSGLSQKRRPHEIGKWKKCGTIVRTKPNANHRVLPSLEGSTFTDSPRGLHLTVGYTLHAFVSIGIWSGTTARGE